MKFLLHDKSIDSASKCAFFMYLDKWGFWTKKQKRNVYKVIKD
jgi:hypothetical protein